jgi:hypothetical protein
MKPRPPTTLDPIAVPCPTCPARHGEPCTSRTGKVTKVVHVERKRWARVLLERASGTTGTARWYRHQFKRGLAPAKPQPCGTEAAFRRHLRNGEPVDEKCRKAAREQWAERTRAKRARDASNNERNIMNTTTTTCGIPGKGNIIISPEEIAHMAPDGNVLSAPTVALFEIEGERYFVLRTARRAEPMLFVDASLSDAVTPARIIEGVEGAKVAFDHNGDVWTLHFEGLERPVFVAC